MIEVFTGPKATKVLFPRCDNQDCDCSNLVPKLKGPDTDEEGDWFELGYLCTNCDTFMQCFSFYSWVFYAIVYYMGLRKEVLPKEAPAVIAVPVCSKCDKHMTARMLELHENCESVPIFHCDCGEIHKVTVSGMVNWLACLHQRGREFLFIANTKEGKVYRV